MEGEDEDEPGSGVTKAKSAGYFHEGYLESGKVIPVETEAFK